MSMCISKHQHAENPVQPSHTSKHTMYIYTSNVSQHDTKQNGGVVLCIPEKRVRPLHICNATSKPHSEWSLCSRIVWSQNVLLTISLNLHVLSLTGATIVSNVPQGDGIGENDEYEPVTNETDREIGKQEENRQNVRANAQSNTSNNQEHNYYNTSNGGLLATRTLR